MKDEEEYSNSIDNLITYAESDSADNDAYTDDIPVIDEEYDPEAEEIEEIEEIDVAAEFTDFDDAADESEVSDAEIHEIEDEYDEYFDDIPYEDDDEITEGGKKFSTRRVVIIASIVLGITAISALLSIDTGIIGTYKANFSKNFSRMFGHFFTQKNSAVQNDTQDSQEHYNTNIRSSVVVSPQGVMNSQIMPYNNGIICASANHLAYIESSGKTVWEQNTAIVEPLLSIDGSYILIAEKNRNKLCLYNDKNFVYEANNPDNILAVNVSPTGDCVLITDKASYRGGISVYNKSGEQIYSWSSGSDAVISADISSPSRKVAVSLLSTETAAKSIIQFFDINETQSYSQINVENTVMFDLEFTGNTLTAFGDNRLVTLSDSGQVISDNDMGSVQLTHSAMDGSGKKVLSFDDGAVPMLRLYDKNGAEEMNVQIKGISDYIDIEGKTVLYNIGRDIYCGRISIDNMTKYTAAMDIKKVMLISQNTFAIVYSNSIEFVII